MSRAGRSPAAWYVAAGLLAGLALAWAFGGVRGPTARAQMAPSLEASGTIALTSGGLSPNSNSTVQYLYLIDTKNQALAIYRFDPKDPKGALRLEAERQYRWDLKLTQHNSSPDVAQIEASIPKR
ncbi:MAG: hypothetical protein IRY99_22525 [Isosphaeraceae bacterium]|nr:hypothetical protein [Isosphaeraceae bacterium]